MEIESSSQPEAPHGEATWEPEDLHRYLLALAHNTPDRDFSLDHQRFPKQITLSPIWHRTFDWMRAITAQDDRERWSMIVVNRKRTKVFISPAAIPTEGPTSPFEADPMRLIFREARRRHMPLWIGDIHSHPRNIPGLPVLEKLREKARQRFWGSYTENDFSVADLYGLLFRRYQTLDRPLSVRFLVGPSENRAVFRTRESPLTDLTVHAFENLWRSQEGDPRKRNATIAARYRLAIYKGSLDHVLLRILG